MTSSSPTHDLLLWRRRGRAGQRTQARRRSLGHRHVLGLAGHSFFTEGSFARWFFIKGLKQAIFAEETDEPDFVKLGWCKPCDQITRADMRPYCREWGVGWAEDGSVELAAGAYWASYEGSLPMLQYMVETVGCELAVANAVGVSPLMYAARQGFDSICTYILDAPKSDGRDAMLAHLDLKTTGWLDSARSTVQRRSTRHGQAARRVARFMARRANGRTPCTVAMVTMASEHLELGAIQSLGGRR